MFVPHHPGAGPPGYCAWELSAWFFCRVGILRRPRISLRGVLRGVLRGLRGPAVPVDLPLRLGVPRHRLHHAARLPRRRAPAAAFLVRSRGSWQRLLLPRALDPIIRLAAVAPEPAGEDC